MTLVRLAFLASLATAPQLAAPRLAAAQALAPAPAVAPRTNGAVTTIAPTPSIGPGRVAPADRAGNNTSDPAGPVASTPFSAGPQGGTGAQIGPASRETEPGGAASTPDLGR